MFKYMTTTYFELFVLLLFVVGLRVDIVRALQGKRVRVGEWEAWDGRGGRG